MTFDRRLLERLRVLVRLAAHEGTPHHEAAAAALEACRRMERAQLLDGLLEECGAEPRRSEAASSGAKECVVRVQAALIVVNETKRSYRVAHAYANSKVTGSPVAGWIPKHLLVSDAFAPEGVVWLDPAQARQLYGTSSRVIGEVLVRKRDVDELRRCVSAKEWTGG